MQLDELTTRVLSYADSICMDYSPLATPIAGLSVMRSRTPTAIMHMIYEPVFCLVLQGAKQAVVGNRVLSFGRMESLVVSLDLPAISHITHASASEPYVALALDLDMTVVRELAADTRLGRPGGSGHAIATQPADEQILDAMRRLFDLVGRPEAAPILRPLIIREIHYWLLTSEHGAMLRESTLADTHAARIARAIAVIRRDYTRSLPVVELARTVGMSVSAFHAHFRSMTGTTPLQFQKQLRLLEARRMMMSRKYSVAGAAFEVGYESPTQFSREYARQFGASPRQDMAEAMSSVAEPIGNESKPASRTLDFNMRGDTVQRPDQ